MLDRQRWHMDPSSDEPFFTNCTRDFLGTLDYIFYTDNSLEVESLLELLDEERLRKDTALPSPEWSSDHIALLAEFRCKIHLCHFDSSLFHHSMCSCQ
jgi:CCR4-NOT transcription complex subunit 6